MLNIGGDTGDAFYRYKMPKLVAKVEGRGNGIKTNVVNNVDIAKALERPPEYIIKYFGCELGAQTKYENGTGTSIVNGAHESAKLAELLEGFIQKYVRCYSCGNPETVVKVKKELISLKCKACGYVSDVDPRHKLNTFILKNPPDNKLSKEEKRLKKVEEERLKGAEDAAKKEKKKDKEKDKEKKDKKDKKDKKKKKEGEEGDPAEDDAAEPEAEASNENGGGAAAAEEEEDDEVVWMTDTSAEAIRKRAAEQLTAATSAMVTQGNIEAEIEEARKRAEKAARKEEEAAARRAEELARRAQSITLADIPDDKLDRAAAEELIALCVLGMEPALAAKAVKKMAVEGGPVARAAALFAAVLGPAAPGDSLAALMKAKQPLFDPKEPAGQLAQLIVLEAFVGVEHPERVKEVPHVLKLMYEEDLAEEEVIVAWFEKADAGKVLGVPAEAARAVRAAAAPVVEWLQNADEDEDEE